MLRIQLNTDFGVRKYDDAVGRFTSIDPLFEKYAGWTPYQYCRNNPVNLLDPSGYADYIDEVGKTINDGVNDGRTYATSKEIIKQNTEDLDGAQGPPNMLWTQIKAVSYLLPSPMIREQMTEGTSAHFSDLARLTEGGGTGNEISWKFGGRESGSSASDVVDKAVQDACNSGIDPSWYSHDQPNQSGYATKPSFPKDYQAINILNNKYGTNIQYGIMFGRDNRVYFFNSTGEESLLSIPLSSFKLKE